MGRVRVEPIRVWLYHHLPAGLLWHPFEWFMAFLCGMTGAVTLSTGVQVSSSIEALLPETPYRLWSGFLLVGALALARGLSSIRWVGYGQYVVTRTAAYRLGLRLLGFSVFLFIAAVFLFAGLAGWYATLVPSAFVAACLLGLIRLGGPDERR